MLLTIFDVLAPCEMCMCLSNNTCVWTIHHSLYDMGWGRALKIPPPPPTDTEDEYGGGSGRMRCHISIEGVKHQLSTQQQQQTPSHFGNSLQYGNIHRLHTPPHTHSQQHTKQRTSAKNAHNIFNHQHQHCNSTSSLAYFILTTAPSLSSFNFR